MDENQVMNKNGWFEETENILRAKKAYDHPRCSSCGALVGKESDCCSRCDATFSEDD